ncbi:hypothetical protein LMG23994_06514 [Cupriavidus pinatubonensis]|uniref:Ribbon-helix-helix protein RHH domain-containing protein n=2 Tax=Cupriavidus pinatubonensis TaxID=248026 RepID=A0ABN7ZM77_9BURK|nr:hypothetical protein LMG23994_06514 [Cupriavidus pinatubonensis]
MTPVEGPIAVAVSPPIWRDGTATTVPPQVRFRIDPIGLCQRNLDPDDELYIMVIILTYYDHTTRMESKTARLTLLIDPEKKKAFETLCAAQDQTPSQVVRRLIRDYLEEHGMDYATRPRVGTADDPEVAVTSL